MGFLCRKKESTLIESTKRKDTKGIDKLGVEEKCDGTSKLK